MLVRYYLTNQSVTSTIRMSFDQNDDIMLAHVALGQ
jgi:hypothetical protein